MKIWQVAALLAAWTVSNSCSGQEQQTESSVESNQPSALEAQTTSNDASNNDELIRKTISTLIESARNTKDAAFRLRLVQILSNTEADSVELLQFLIEMTGNNDEEISSAAKLGVAQFNPAGTDTSELVLDWLKSNDESKAAFAVSILSKRKGHLEDELIRLIDQGMINAGIRDSIFQILANWGSLKKSSFANLTKMYQDREALRQPILKLVSSLQVDSLATLELLNQAIKDDDKTVRDLALSAIEEILNPVQMDSTLQGIVDSLMSRFDSDGDRMISAEEDARGRFRLLDTNGDGSVSPREIAAKYAPAIQNTTITREIDRDPFGR